MDLLQTPRDVADRLKQRISVRNHIATEDIALCCTHTHTGPAIGAPKVWGRNDLRDEAYIKTLAAKVSGAVHEALKEAVPVTVAFARHPVDIGNVNRRVRQKDGSYLFLGQHPHLAPNGPAAREFAMIFFKDPDRKLVAGIGHYSSHPIFTPSYLHKVTGDYAGIFSQAVEKEVGDGCVIAFLQGTLGDQMPRKFCSSYQLAIQAGRKLAYCFLNHSSANGGKP